MTGFRIGEAKVFRAVCLGWFALAAAGTAWSVEVGYTDCEGSTIVFDSAKPPSWAIPAAVPTHRAKYNQILFNITYLDVQNDNNKGFDDPVLGAARRDVVNRVLEYIGDVLNETAPAACDIVFNVSKTDASGFLASAGPFYLTSPNGFSSGFAQEHIATGVDSLPGTADISSTVDFGYPWYTASAVPVTAGQYDLFSVLLHEMTHGLGVLSLSNAAGASKISGANPGVYSVWDKYMETGSGGIVLFNNTTTVFAGNTSYLTGNSGGLALDSPFAKAAFGGVRPPIYAPATFSLGSSLSHFSTSISGPVVMKPSISAGVAIRTYAAFEIGVLKDIGYVNAEAPTPPDLDFASPTFSIAEGNTVAALTVSLSEAPGPGNLTRIDYAVTGGTAVAGKDYTMASGTLQFDAFDVSKTVNVQILDDAFSEPDKTVVVTLSNPVNAVLTGTNNPATLTIVDTDILPGVDFSSAAYSLVESATTVTLQVRLTDAPGVGNTATVNYAASPGTATLGTDYLAAAGTLSFGAADTVKTINIAVVNDTKHEANETITVTLSNPASALLVNATNPATVTIVDDDPDTDGDGISDTDEISGVNGYLTNPLRRDSDNDLISDLDEILATHSYLTNPTIADSDGDGVDDGAEISLGTDPLNFFDVPAVETIAVPLFEEGLPAR